MEVWCAVDERTKKVKCNLRDKELWGGVTRLKQHLALVKGETTGCTRVLKEVMEMMNRHLREAKKLKKIQEKKKAEFYDEIRGSNRYDEGEDEDEDVGDEVEAELLQAMRRVERAPIRMS